MSRRNALPDELDPNARQLVEHLRRLKDHSELSMRQLATKTGYSQKSWERYLGGRSLPPREAVETLARICGDDPVRLLALHEVAADTWPGPRPTASPTSPSSPSESEPPAESDPPATTAGQPATTAEQPAAVGTRVPGRSLRIALGAGAVALVLAVSSTVLLVLRLNDDDGRHAAAAVPSTAPASSHAPVYTCAIERTDGLWYAGISRTQNTEIFYGSVGPDVAEAQCLLRRAGISPGGIDGEFGPLTQRAVKAMQKRSGLIMDGIVGPKTWKALRG
ncbi:peptidoglycan-binding protein [Streptomyces sp. NPDC006872]|uniref:peptidoglycan-binding protein n=1 Tax=Streptomyces sp. NPDC006872 TaxID=3155720 RepID=UPI0033DE572C